MNLKSLLKCLAFFYSFSLIINANGQIVHLTNRSFEDRPGANRVPTGWTDCGYQFPGETPPDTQPCGAWQVTQNAIDGNTYVGLVVRENKTWEALSQKLNGILKKDSTYNFEILICTSENYISLTHTNSGSYPPKYSNYNISAVLRIWGANKKCKRGNLLAESPPIKNNDWQVYKFTIKPPEDVSFIIFEAYYNNETTTAYIGNILIDGASAFTPVSKTSSSQNPVEE